MVSLIENESYGKVECGHNFWLNKHMLHHLRVITLKMICHCIENDIKFNGEIIYKNITNLYLFIYVGIFIKLIYHHPLKSFQFCTFIWYIFNHKQ